MALLEGYHTALMKGRYPICCLFLELHPSRVDVNIHPSKREVKFRNERGMRGVVVQAVKQALLDYHGGPEAGAAIGAEGSIPAPSAPEIGGAAVGARVALDRPVSRPDTEARDRDGTALPGMEAVEPPSLSGREATLIPVEPDARRAGPRSDPPGVESGAGGGTVGGPGGGVTPLLDVPLRLVGVIGKLYVVLESDRGLVLMDQHAAHERVVFEQMLRRMEQGDAPSQRLLLPETVEVSVRDAQFLRDQLQGLIRMGVGLSEFGERTFLLDALPPFVKVVEPRRFVVELVDALKATGQEVNTHRLGEDTIAKTVCRHAVKANDALAGEELERLVADLRGCEMPYTCPHGRPTLIEMSYKELDKRFGRMA
jgi:DNA mismatch repair protein MutL